MINNPKRNIMIIGSGVVGQATGKGFAKKGNNIVFVDTKVKKIEELLNEGFIAYLPEDLEKQEIKENLNLDVVMFSVSTPEADDSSVNLDRIVNAVTSYAKWIKLKANNNNNNNNNNSKYHAPLVVIRSTVLPGATEKILLPLIEKHSGMKVGQDFGFGLCMQPEFLRATSAEKDFLTPPMIVIGQYDKYSGDILQEIYSDFGCQIVRVDIRTAEFMKYVHNCFNATKISFANEMWLLGQRLSIDSNRALELAVKSAEGYWNPAYGTVGGWPYGGACLPKDTKGLLEFTKEIGVDMPLLSATIEVNSKIAKLKEEEQKITITTGDQSAGPLSASPLSRRKQKSRLL
jgi:UDPglucose 6-dehydrogenase